MIKRSQLSAPEDRLIVACDEPDIASLIKLTEAIQGHANWAKVGLEIITAIGGPVAASAVREAGMRCMYDAKFHDIPNTMAGAAKAASSQGIEMFTIHASADVAGIKAAVQNAGSATVVGVTVLTSMNFESCRDIYGLMPDTAVCNFAGRLLEGGAGAVVCSAKEAEILRKKEAFNELVIITPGIRPVWAGANDQARVMTPRDALNAGVDMLVVGRPIKDYPDGPAAAIKLILDEIREATR